MQFGLEAFLSETQLNDVTSAKDTIPSSPATMNPGSESSRRNGAQYGWTTVCEDTISRIKQEAPDTTFLDLTGFHTSGYSSPSRLSDDIFAPPSGWNSLSVPQVGIPSPSGSTCSSMGGESPLMYESHCPSDSGYSNCLGGSPQVVTKQEPGAGGQSSCAYSTTPPHGGTSAVTTAPALCKLLSSSVPNGIIKTESPADPASSVCFSSSTCHLLPLEQFEQVQTWAREQAARDIYHACEVLAIPPDPSKWSQDQVRTWFTWVLQQHQLPGGYADLFRTDGRSLCRLTESDFKQRAPLCGDILYALLDIWKNSALADDSGSTKQFVTSSSSAPFRPEESVVDFRRYGRWQSGGRGSPCASPPTASQMPATRFPSTFESAGSTGSSSGSTTPSSLVEALGLSIGLSHPRGASSDRASQGGCSIAGSDVATDSLPSDDEGVEDMEVDRRPGSQSHIHLWQFLKELLAQPQMYGSCIRWLDRPKGIFKIEDSVRVARLWGKRKNRPAMNYDKLSRSIRQYYKKGIMKKTERSQRLVYQFCHPYSL